MNRNFTSVSIKIIILAYVIITVLIIKESYFDSTVIKDISIITSSFCTLIIALLLFDRFDYRKKIFDKKLDIVLKLLEALKTTSIKLSYNHIEQGRAFGGSPFLIDKKQLNIPFLKEHIDFNACVLFEPESIFTYIDVINLYRANPFMPKEIVESLDFLSITSLTTVINDAKYNNNYVKVSINSPMKNISTLDKWSRTRDAMDFQTLIMGYLNCLDSIEKWINKHSNFDADLNL